KPDVAEKLIRRLVSKIKLHADEIAIYDEYATEDAEVLVIAYGITARSALKAVKIARQDRIKVGLFKPVTIWPVPVSRLKKLLSRVEAVVIAEMNLGQYTREILTLMKKSLKLKVITKVSGELITPGEILDGISEVLMDHFEI
ncbi:MAG: 2-oxoacid:acceptor oxidoreductase subunit alpha, partial [Candidatus Desulfofervidus sp.]|nr:2-oxoacid:acceptor oxidoreductase subunit alpha [Candidatus Desulfofervidus sp.]